MSRVLAAGTVVGQLTGLPDGAVRSFDLTDDEWPLRGILVRVGNDVHAWVNRCPHAGRPLDFGGRFMSPDGELLQCHAHGALFERHTGMCVAGPCVDESLRRIPVRGQGDDVCLAEDVDTDRLQRGPW